MEWSIMPQQTSMGPFTAPVESWLVCRTVGGRTLALMMSHDQALAVRVRDLLNQHGTEGIDFDVSAFVLDDGDD